VTDIQCHATGNRVSVDAVEPQSLLADPAFLNKLQADVNSWIKEIQAVTKLSRDVSSGTASQEINFWLSMEHALEGIEAQLKGEEVTLALDVLKHAKRFHATVSFIADTGLKEAADLGEIIPLVGLTVPSLNISAQAQHLDEGLPTG
jgi:dynein heavy chain 1